MHACTHHWSHALCIMACPCYAKDRKVNNRFAGVDIATDTCHTGGSPHNQEFA